MYKITITVALAFAAAAFSHPEFRGPYRECERRELHEQRREVRMERERVERERMRIEQERMRIEAERERIRAEAEREQHRREKCRRQARHEAWRHERPIQIAEAPERPAPAPHARIELVFPLH